MRIALPLVLLALSIPCRAEPPFTKQYDECREAADGGGPFERLGCITAEAKRQGVVLGEAYKAALKASQGEKQQRLRESQREWLKYQNANCELFYNAERYPVADEARAYCVMRMTAERAAELADISAQ